MSEEKNIFDVIVIGAGAAGLFCSAQAGFKGLRVLLLEHNAEVGRKIVISGGGRCNFTNSETIPEAYLSQNEHFCKSALARYGPQDFLSLIGAYEIKFFEKKLGQLFCKESSREIVEMLLGECDKAQVLLKTGVKVESVQNHDSYEVRTSKGVFFAGKLVVATGGLSIPKIGATDFGYSLARQFGLKVRETSPALVPLTLGENTLPGFKGLAGISVPARVSYGEIDFLENVLVTHWGLSGPAILQISLYWERGEAIEIDWLPDNDLVSCLLEAKAKESRTTIPSQLKRFLPNRFVDVWCALELENPERFVASIKDDDLISFAKKLKGWRVVPSGTQGYKKAEVTRGGVSTSGLSSKTMEAKTVSGLFFIGEVVDVTGWLGGYNFQWAWASANACAEAL
ncbi:MAG: NAD(P)/FAD-dependent oxidoreductase [Myxococcota bacterium]|nr:NAD(P)/FAD-dependent oxidoreductase [Myxococcota bacterium]